MMRAARVLAVQARIAALEELQYRTNFFAYLWGSLGMFAMSMVAYGILFGHVDSINGWTRPELVAVLGTHYVIGAFCVGIVHMSMSQVVNDVMTGVFDYRLLRPFDAQLLGVTQKVQVWRLLDIPFGLALIAWGVAHSDTAPRGLDLVGASLLGLVLLAAAVVTAAALWTLFSSLVFFTIQGEGILWALDDIYEDVRWPITMFGPGLQRALTFGFPMGIAVTVPPEAVLGRLDPLLAVQLVAISLALLVLSRLAWNRALSRYSSASS
jgi:ABC-2 type transport system permease protein